MKKVLIAALSLCMVFAVLAGCSSKSGSGEPSASASQAIEYAQGKITDDGFESEYIGMRFTTPEGFIMATEQEIETAMNAGADIMEMDEDKVEAAKEISVYEMMAVAPAGSPNVVVMTEKLSLQNMDEETYFSALKTQLGQTGVAYEFSDDIETVDIAGQSYKMLVTEASYYGQALTQKYYIRKSGERMISIITTSNPDTEEELEKLMGGFSKY